MVKLSFRQTIVVIVLAAALLVALLGGLLRSASVSGPSATPHSTHPPLAWYCPAPPVVC